MNPSSYYSNSLLTILIGVAAFLGNLGIGNALQYTDSIEFSVTINNDVTTPNLSPLPLSLDGSTQVISWTTSSPMISQRYTLEQATNESFIVIVQTFTLDNSTTQTIPALASGRYCYRVRSTGIENLQASTWSNVLCHDFGNIPGVTPPVVNLAASTGAPIPVSATPIPPSTASWEVSVTATGAAPSLSASGTITTPRAPRPAPRDTSSPSRLIPVSQSNLPTPSSTIPPGSLPLIQPLPGDIPSTPELEIRIPLLPSENSQIGPIDPLQESLSTNIAGVLGQASWELSLSQDSEVVPLSQSDIINTPPTKNLFQDRMVYVVVIVFAVLASIFGFIFFRGRGI